MTEGWLNLLFANRTVCIPILITLVVITYDIFPNPALQVAIHIVQSDL